MTRVHPQINAGWHEDKNDTDIEVTLVLFLGSITGQSATMGVRVAGFPVYVYPAPASFALFKSKMMHRSEMLSNSAICPTTDLDLKLTFMFCTRSGPRVDWMALCRYRCRKRERREKKQRDIHRARGIYIPIYTYIYTFTNKNHTTHVYQIALCETELPWNL